MVEFAPTPLIIVAGLVSAFQCMSLGHESHLLLFFKHIINQEFRDKCVLNLPRGYKTFSMLNSAECEI